MLFFGGKVVSFFSFVTFLCIGGTVAEDCSIRKTSSKLFCYYSKVTDVNSCQCTHVVLPLDADVKAIDAVRKRLTDVKVLLTVNSFSESLITLLKATRIDGLDLRLTKLAAKDDIQDFISTIRSKLGPNLILTLAVPARAELLAKHYDFKALSKHVDSFILETAFLGASGNVTFHPSRLSGLWDVQNTDSVVDLVSGLGAPLQKLVIAAPVQAFKFTLQDAGHTAPGSPALELSTISRKDLCDAMSKNKWILERDQDQAGPYIFRDKTWIAFEDPTSIDIKSKYSRIRGLAGLALKDLSQDAPCAQAVDSPNIISILEAAHSGLTKQSRAPRGAVLQSLEREILGTQRRLLDTVQVSPYRITRVVDTEGKVHAIRQDTRTEFECSRQGYFIHPRSCGRFYRCVKFDQLSEEYSVFEFDCPAGLVFDGRVEVCVWPGSVPQASACSGSSEIAPVPKGRFICPGETGYYADPENCRWFFACLDHGKSPLSAYEFRCPFGLVFDQERLLCEWPWLVPKCSSGFAEGTYEEYAYGGIGTGALAGSGYITTEDTAVSKTGLILGQYNGLGSLKSVSLGGLSGPLVQPVAKTYSSFSSEAGLLHGRDAYVLDYKPIGTSVIAHGHQARLNDFVDESHLINGNLDLYRINNNQQGVFDVDDRFASGSQINFQPQEGGLNLKLANSNLATATSFANLNQQNLHSVGDNINIIGGGFSAVGGSGVELSQYGSNIGHIQHVTPLPIEGSSTIATVTSVPIPIVRNTDFDIYKTGVVANIPNLQYKVSSPGAVNTFFNQGYQSTASSFNKHSLIKNFVSSSTPIVPTDTSFFDSSRFSGYNNEKPSISFVDGSSIAPPVVQVQQQGYDYPKAIVSFAEEEKPAVITTKEYLPPVFVTTVQPPAVIVTKDYLPPVSVATIQTPIIKPQEYLPPPKPIQPSTGQSYSYSHQNQIHTKVEQPIIQIQQTVGYEIPQAEVVQLEQRQPQFLNTIDNAYNQQPSIIKSEGYSYPKPTIKFEDIPKINQVFSSSQVQQSADGYNYPKPTITTEEKQTVLRIETQPQGYIYTKPAIRFEENPSAVSSQSFVQHNTFVNKPVESKFVQPKVATQENVGYAYPQPSVQFAEEPLHQPQVVKIDQYPIKFEHKPATSSQSITQHVQPQVIQQTVEYQYPKPQIKFEEKPLLNQYIPPKVVQGYTYSKPAIKFEEKQPIVTQYVQPKIQQQTFVYQKPQVTQYINPLQPKLVHQGYSYPKPNIAFEEHQNYVKPTQTQVVQPAVQIQQNFDYSYPKPTIKFEEIQQTYVRAQPAVSSQVFTQHNYVKPVETKIEIPQNYGYVPLQPAVKFEEKPVVVQQNYVTPQPIVHVQETIGYEYPKPTIKFEEKPTVIQHTFITPKPAIHVQENIGGYSYSKPSIKFEEKPAISKHTFVTPKPVIHIQENIGYSHQNPSIKFEEKPTVIQHTFVTPKPVIHIQENVGYEYPKPTIKFEEKPAVIQHTYLTPKPVIHIQENIGYSYSKPSIKFEEKPAIIKHTFVTPKPVIHIQENVGYPYPKPSIKFEEKPVVIQQTFVTPRPVVYVQENIGYVYPKPATKFEENYVQPVIQQTYIKPVQPIVHLLENNHQRYEYPKPAIRFEEQPVVIQQAVVTAKPSVVHVQQNVGYEYPKPAIKYQEKPVVIHQQTNYVKPVSLFSFSSQATKQSVTPVVQQNIDYAYPKPAIKFEEKPVSYNTYSYQNIKHNQQTPVVYEAKPIQPAALPTYTYQKPRALQIQPIQHQQSYIYEKPVEQKIVQVQQPALNQQKPAVQQVQVGYEYPQPQIKFEEKPVISYENRQPVQEEIIVPKKAYVTGYQNNEGYVYNKPSVAFEEVRYEAPRVTPRPTYVSTVASVVVPKIQQIYSYDSRFESRPQVLLQEQPIVDQKTVVESKPIFKYEFSSLDNSFNSYVAPPQKEYLPQVVSTTQGYIEPAGPVQQYIASKPQEQKIGQVQQPALTQSYHYQQTPAVQQVQVGYEYPKPQIKFEEKPVISYENRQPVQEEIIVPKKAYVTGYQNNEGYVYNKPSVAFEEVRYEAPRVTPRPTYVSTVASVVVPKIQQIYSYDSRFESKPQVLLQEQPIVDQKTVVESKPIFKYEFSSLDNSFNSYVAPPQKEYLPQVVSTTQGYIEPARPVQQYIASKPREQKTYVQSKPIAHYEFSSFDKEYKTYIAPPVVQVLTEQTTPKFVNNVEVKQSRPIGHYEFSSFDSRFEPQKEFVHVASTTPKYVSTPQFQINVPDLEYLPVRKVVIQPPKVYIPAITTEKVVVRTRKPPTIIEKIITIPKRTYLPVTTEKVIVTLPVQPDREYLPIKTGKFIENYEAENSEEVVSRRPAKIVKLVRPKSKSIIKVNDFHPILSTKLGAQCTCTSNTLRLRKPAKQISVQVEERKTRISDLEEYIQNEEETGDIIIEEYQYEPQKIQNQQISVTQSPQFIVKSTTEELYSNAPAPNLVIKKRLRGARPTATTAIYEPPVSKASDIFIRRSGRPKQIVIVDQEIVDAVKLVKTAGLRESAIGSKTFDRYGPGGVRSRSETLQGTIDCQRAGLFRHPTHCNKFYACRWDCTKNRFTLHVFNCPVHLTFDNKLGACNWPSQGPACVDNTLLPNE